MGYTSIQPTKTITQLVRMLLLLARISFQFARHLFNLHTLIPAMKMPISSCRWPLYLSCCEIYEINLSCIWHMMGYTCIQPAKTITQLVRMHLQLARISFQFMRTAFQLAHLKISLKFLFLSAAGHFKKQKSAACSGFPIYYVSSNLLLIYFNVHCFSAPIDCTALTCNKDINLVA
jgi:hypothetical protein